MPAAWSLELPATSVALACRLWLPSVRLLLGVMLQLPCASATTLPISVSVPLTLSYRSTSAFASAVPVMVGMGLLLAEGPVITGLPGGTVSTTTVLLLLAPLSLPAASFAFTVSV